MEECNLAPQVTSHMPGLETYSHPPFRHEEFGLLGLGFGVCGMGPRVTGRAFI